MPGKSKHGKGKHPHYHRKIKARQRQAGTALPQTIAGNVTKSAIPVGASALTSPKAAASAAASTIYPRDYTISEIKRIGILTGIIAIILIVLYFTIS